MVAGEREASLGITEFLTPGPGFVAISKQRFADFIVHEVALSGEPVRLEALAEAPTAAAATSLATAETGAADAPGRLANEVLVDACSGAVVGDVHRRQCVEEGLWIAGTGAEELPIDEILLDDRVYFHVNADQVRVRSWAVLESVADLLIAHPQYAIIRIQGHADDTGDDAYNKALSERRSRSVRNMLIRYGVEPDRLVTEGFGEDRPQLEPDEKLNERTVFARNKNRRVEFLILRRRTLAEVAAERAAKAPSRESDGAEAQK